MLLRDPLELKDYAERGDPPMADWPGLEVGRTDIMAASGDLRDWFRYRHRLMAAERIWHEFISRRYRRERRGDLSSGFKWNQILVIGDYGAGKTTLATYLARYFFRRGHAVFSSASCLFGWRLSQNEVYTAMGFIPKHSVLLVDEASAALSSRMGGSVSVSTFVEMALNTRKQNCIIVFMSAQDRKIAYDIRHDCREVWMPLRSEDMVVRSAGSRRDVEPANDPDNFRLAWHVWDDYPYRQRNIIEGKDPDAEGFGPPARTKYVHGEEVRQAMLLNDTFELAKAGAATTADRDEIKDAAAAFQSGDRPPAQPNRASASHGEMMALFEYLQLQELEGDDENEYLSAAEIGNAIGTNSSTAGKLVQELTTVKPVRNKGYSKRKLFAKLRERWEEPRR